MIPSLRRRALTLSALMLVMVLSVRAGESAITDCVGRYLDYDRFKSELRYPVDAFEHNQQGDVTLEIAVDTLGRIESVEASGAGGELVEGVRSALLWGSNPKPPSSSGVPFSGSRSLTIRFLSKDVTSMPRSESELIVRPVFGRQAEGTGRTSLDELVRTSREPTFDYGDLQRHVTYPEAARRLGIEGGVRVKAFVGRDGTVEEMFAEVSDHPLFSEAAMAAIRATKFIAATGPDGKPVGVWVTIPMHFRLN